MKKFIIALILALGAMNASAWDDTVRSGTFVLTGCSVMQYDNSGITVLYRAYNDEVGSIVWRENNDMVSTDHPEALKFGKLRVGQVIEFVDDGSKVRIIHDGKRKVDDIPCAAQGYK